MAGLAHRLFSLGDSVVVKRVWSRLSSGGNVAVWRGDDSTQHHRLLLVTAQSVRYVVFTSVGDVLAWKMLGEGGMRSLTRCELVIMEGRSP